MPNAEKTRVLSVTQLFAVWKHFTDNLQENNKANSAGLPQWDGDGVRSVSYNLQINTVWQASEGKLNLLTVHHKLKHLG